MKVTSSEQYQTLLQQFLDRLYKSIPSTEDTAIDINPANPMLRMQYGGSAMMVSLNTKSSGHDNYLVWVDNNGQGQFIRVIGG